MKFKLLVLTLFFTTYSLAGTINIAVAANVSYAMDELKKEFNKLYPDTKVQVTLGSTGKLSAQIKNGAPYQLFLAANMQYPQALYDEDIALTRPIVYAQGSLAYISTKKQDFSKGIMLLKEKNIKKIAVANPKTAPYGIAAVEAMKNSGIYETIKDKFVYAESISQTVSYAVTATDIGLIAKSSLFSPKMKRFKKGINWTEVDTKLYTPIDQGMVLLKKGKKNCEAASFYAFMLSKKAKNILKKFGYTVP